jgi:hypothetical protein
VYAHRRGTIVLSLVGFVLSLVAVTTGGEPQNANSFDFESGGAFSLMSEQLPSSGVTFTLILGDRRGLTTAPFFRDEVDAGARPACRRSSRRSHRDSVQRAGHSGRADGVA